MHLASGISLKLQYKRGVLVLKLKKPQEGNVLKCTSHKLTPEEGWDPRNEKDVVIKKEEVNEVKP